MWLQNAKQDIPLILSWFSEAFSRPSFRIFSSFVVGFIQLGKEPHSSSMVQSVAQLSVRRSLCSFTRFLGENVWATEEVMEKTLGRFFHFLKIRASSVVFLIVDDTIVHKTGRKIPGCAWYKDHAQNMANVFGHQWVVAALVYKDFLFPLWTKLYHPKAAKGCGRFQTKIAMVKGLLKNLRLPVPCKLYILADSWYWGKPLAKPCLKRGYHMISQLKVNARIVIDGKRTRVTKLATRFSAYRQVCLSLYGKNKALKIARFVGTIKDLGQVAVVVVKEKRKKIRYLVCTNIGLSTIDIIQFYAKRWKIEQMIKDLKQRLGFGTYQVRSLQAIHRHQVIAMLSYFVLTLLKILQWSRNKNISLALSIRLLAFYVRKYILAEAIALKLKTMKVFFKQNLLDIYLEQLCV